MDLFSSVHSKKKKKGKISTVGVGAHSQEMSACYLWEASWLVEAEQSDLVLDEWRCAHSPVADALLLNEEQAAVRASLLIVPTPETLQGPHGAGDSSA